ncbi:MAG: hypothetical protein HY832_00210 [Candidatus Aenigmarchaeota archaeon]|nr:hypothetical protein [Candidatus Aenigmarchaeota archaeon]
MADPFTTLVTNLNQLGFFGFLLPWMFVFVVSYAILLKSKVLGESQRIMGVLSLVIAFFVIGFGGPALAGFFINLFGIGSLILAGILVLILFVALSGGDPAKILTGKAALAVLGGIGLVIFAIAAGSFGVKINESVFAIIFIIAVLALAMLFVTGEK